MVPAWVLKYLKGAEVAVYVSLRTFADRAGYGFPHTKTIADRAGVSVSSTRNCIQKMRKMGLVHTTERRRGDGSLAGLDYLLVDIEPSGGGVPPGSDLLLPAEIESRSLVGVTGVPPGSDAVTPQKNTPKPPPPTSSTHAPVDDVAEVEIEEEEFPSDLKNFVANLDYHGQTPSRTEYVRVANAAKSLWGQVEPFELKRRIQHNASINAQSLVAIYVKRLNSLTVMDFKTKTASTGKFNSSGRPPWCDQPGVCDPNTRRTINAEGFVTRIPCPRCSGSVLAS